MRDISKTSVGGELQPNTNDGRMSEKQLSAPGSKDGSKKGENWDLKQLNEKDTDIKSPLKMYRCFDIMKEA